jgi:hypothetical protein
VVQHGRTRSEQRVEVIDQGSQPMDVMVQKTDFTPGTDGTLVFARTAPYSASNWVTVSPSRLHVAPGATATVSVRINVPRGAEPGDHQVALIFLVPAGTNGANIRINRGIGVPVYVSAPGAIDDSVSVTSLHAPGFALTGPIKLTAGIHDTGTVHRDFRGVGSRLPVEIDGRQVTFPDFTVTRGATREITTNWTDPPLACVCHAVLSVPGADGVPHVVRATIVIIPLHLIGGLLFAIAFVVVVALLVRRRYRIQVTRAAAKLQRLDGEAL